MRDPILIKKNPERFLVVHGVNDRLSPTKLKEGGAGSQQGEAMGDT